MEKKAVRVAYGEALVKLGEENEKVVVLDADLAGATMTNGFKKAYPNRFYDCGIAEANMVDVAAGMSTMGLIPFCSTFAVFAGRNYDQIRNGVCYPKFNVKFGFSHAGITLGEDGGSHQAIEDIALMRVLPGMTVFVPSDANECYQCVEAAAKIEGPVYIRTARLATPVYDPRPLYHYAIDSGGVTSRHTTLTPRKISGLKTYEKIAEITHANYPYIESIAYASLCNMCLEDIYIYYKSGVKSKEIIDLLRNNFCKHRKIFYKSNAYTKRDKRFSSFVVIHPRVYYYARRIYWRFIILLNKKTEK